MFGCFVELAWISQQLRTSQMSATFWFRIRTFKSMNGTNISGSCSTIIFDPWPMLCRSCTNGISRNCWEFCRQTWVTPEFPLDGLYGPTMLANDGKIYQVKLIQSVWSPDMSDVFQSFLVFGGQKPLTCQKGCRHCRQALGAVMRKHWLCPIILTFASGIRGMVPFGFIENRL